MTCDIACRYVLLDGCAASWPSAYRSAGAPGPHRRAGRNANASGYGHADPRAQSGQNHASNHRRIYRPRPEAVIYVLGARAVTSCARPLPAVVVAGDDVYSVWWLNS